MYISSVYVCKICNHHFADNLCKDYHADVRCKKKLIIISITWRTVCSGIEDIALFTLR